MDFHHVTVRLNESVEALNVPIPIAAYNSSKEKWYDRTLLFRADSLPGEAFAEGGAPVSEDLGLADGIFSFQYIVRDGVPYVIDMMRRCFGNETLLLADMRTGFPWEEAYIRASLGMDCTGLECQPQTYKYCGHYGVMADRNGVLESWTLPEDIEGRLFKKTVNLESGAVIRNYLTEKIAHIYFHYDDLETMNREIIEYNDRIRVKMREA